MWDPLCLLACCVTVLEAVDQGKMFDAVNAALHKGECLGIFPEGGSHDQTDLLPLKVSISVAT
jgi:glycerol-3-phosphate O-acyltransferase/dihydroxyacetone phosphate acyltransferase